MKKVLIFLLLCCSCAALAQDKLARLGDRADRSFDGEEWAAAAAQYELMLEMKADSAHIYSRAIVASDMANDTIAPADLLERAMSHNIGLSALLADVRSEFFAIGQGDRYGLYLGYLWEQCPWLQRPLAHELLSYFTFRHDGEMMVKFARIMLSGLPDSVEYLRLLADGYILCNNDSAAVGTWRQILEIDPDDWLTLIAIGNYLSLHDNPAEGVAYLTRARDIRSTPALDAAIK